MVPGLSCGARLALLSSVASSSASFSRFTQRLLFTCIWIACSIGGGAGWDAGNRASAARSKSRLKGLVSRVAMFSLSSIPDANGCVTLSLTGSVSEDVLPEIDRLIDSGKRAKGKVALDLSEVTLIDRVSARFFADQLQRGIELVDC